MGLLNGDIAALFGSVMGEFYLPATLRKVTLVPDGYGGGTTTVSTESVKVQVDQIKEEVRAQMGYTQDTQRFFILQSSVNGPITGDSELTHDGVTYMLQTPEQDPAKSYWSVIGVPRRE